MKFRYYFFKEQNRVYDKAELLTYLEAQPFMTLHQEGAIKIAEYHNNVLDMNASFVLNTKSIVPNIQRLNPAYLDLNIYVEFDVVNNTYKVSKIIDMIEVICRRFNFLVYNECFEDVLPFKRSLLTGAFELVKQAYKKKYEEEFMNYSKLSKQCLESIYAFLEVKDQLTNIDNYQILDYVFLRERETRLAYVAVTLDLSKPFIIPPSVQLVKIVTEDTERIVSLQDLKRKIGKYLSLVDSRLIDVYMVEERYFKAVKKTIAKLKLDEVKVPLREVPFKSVLDL